MEILEHVNIGAKTSMRIGGEARYYTELETKSDAEEAQKFAKEKNLPLITLGGGCNTVFADGTIEAVVVRVKADSIVIKQPVTSNQLTIIRVEAGTTLATLINELAAHDLDLSALTGIPGTFGGAIVGNAGQGPKGIWTNSFVESVTALVNGAWKIFDREACGFRYRESIFKTLPNVIVWDATLKVPFGAEPLVREEIQKLLQKRRETQPALRTAGSCFKAVSDGTPAWKLIEAAGLRGAKVGGIQISEKHANFLLNVDHGTFADLRALTEKVRAKVPQIEGIEMRLYGNDGRIVR